MKVSPIFIHFPSFPQDLSKGWLSLSRDPLWQLHFVTLGVADEIPPQLLIDVPVEAVAPVPAPVAPVVPKAVHQSRPARFMRAKPEEPVLKAPRKNPKTTKAQSAKRPLTALEGEDEDDELALEDEEDWAVSKMQLDELSRDSYGF